MHSLHRWLTLSALATYLLVGGAAGLCTLFGNLGIEHHHHALHAHADSTHACAGDSEGCRKPGPTQPCGDSADQDDDEFLALIPDSSAPIASPLVGDVPPPATDFSGPTAVLAADPLSSLLGDVRGSLDRQPAVLCRFLV